MQEARAMHPAEPPEYDPERRTTPIAAVPNPVEAPPTVDESSSAAGDDTASSRGDDYTEDDVLDMLEDMPIENAAEVVRDYFAGLSPEAKERATEIFLQQEREPEDQ